ncbi:hypothetical protein PTZ02_10080 [Clostridium sp. 'White wine YQ']|nr:hypothetical protein [Clostridium sp. 'White wine YQ']
MNASLSKLLDFSINKYLESNIVKDNVTDFDLGINYGFPCLDKVYNFNFSRNGLETYIQNLI